MISFSNWIKNNRVEALAFFLIIIISASLRFYRIDEYMTFLGDEGRDAIVIKKILTEFDLPLIGPPTSVGNMYLGPLYYYMMAVPMGIFGLNPMAAAGMVAGIGTISVGLIYYLSRSWFGILAAVFSSWLYGLSPINIVYSRSSWNPNPAPFFTLLIILSLYKGWTKRDGRWFILTGLFSAFLIQMHYLALIFLPVIFVFWFLQLIRDKYYEKTRNLYRGTLIGFLIFIFLMSPLVIFDFRHNFINFWAITTFFNNRETTVNLNAYNSIERVMPIYTKNLIGEYIVGENLILIYLLSGIVLIPVFVNLYLILIKGRLNWPLSALSFWLISGVVGLSLYKQSIFAHYLGFLNPVPFFIIGSLFGLIEALKNRNLRRVLGGALVVLVLTIAITEINRSPLRYEPNNQLSRTQAIAKYIINQSKGEPFNFALIAEHNYDDAYQFYLDIYNHKPKKLPFEKTKMLFVVCEDKVCQPVGHPKYEIAAFGWTKIEGEESFNGVRIFKLVDYQGF